MSTIELNHPGFLPYVNMHNGTRKHVDDIDVSKVDFVSIMTSFLQDLNSESLDQILANAQNGDGEAMLKAGDRYYFGLGVKMDRLEAGEWWLKAADVKSGNTAGKAYSSLAFLYYEISQNKGDQRGLPPRY